MLVKTLLSSLNELKYNAVIKIFHDNKVYEKFEVLDDYNIVVISVLPDKNISNHSAFGLKKILDSLNKEAVIDFSFPGESTQFPVDPELLIVPYQNFYLLLV